MKKALILLLGFFYLGILPAQNFQRLLDHLNSLPVSQRQAVVDSFMNATATFPYIEVDTMVHFVYFQDAQSVAMAGDATDWNPSKNLTRITGCNFWYYNTTYEADARLDYKFVINGSEWILDPKNPYTCTGGYGPNSELRMPAYQVPPETAYYADIPHGALKDTTFHSAILGNTRSIRIYLPPGYSTGASVYPVVLFHDGLEYITLCKANNILDYLIAHQQMVPVIGVFVPPVDREAEYAGDKMDNFTRFIIEELMPVIDTKYRTSRDSSKRAMAGASNGGNISLYIGMKHPEQFGKIAAQSSNVTTAISNTFANGPKLGLELYLDIGTYDLAELIPLVHNFLEILRTRDYLFQFYEVHEGHSWGNWSGHLRLPLMQFFPAAAGFNERPTLKNIRLGPNHPNPFHGQTRIPFFAPVGSMAELTLTDTSGRKLETLFRAIVTDKENTVTFNGQTYTPGNYFYTLSVDGYRTSRIITIER